jgi:hypothetical protein
MAVHIIININLYLYDLCMFIGYLVYITQALKDTLFRLDNNGVSVEIYLFINVCVCLV